MSTNYTTILIIHYTLHTYTDTNPTTHIHNHTAYLIPINDTHIGQALEELRQEVTHYHEPISDAKLDATMAFLGACMHA